MTLEKCPQCTETICLCGHAYKDLPLTDLCRLRNALELLIRVKMVERDLDFAKTYGSSRLAELGQVLDEDQALRLYRNFLDTYPQLREWYEKNSHAMQKPPSGGVE